MNRVFAVLLTSTVVSFAYSANSCQSCNNSKYYNTCNVYFYPELVHNLFSLSATCVNNSQATIHVHITDHDLDFFSVVAHYHNKSNNAVRLIFLLTIV